MIYQDLYETRPCLKREPQDREVIKQLKETGHNIPGDISTRSIWFLTKKELDNQLKFEELPYELRSWNREALLLPEIGRKRLNRSLYRLQLVIDPKSPIKRSYTFGVIGSKQDKVIPKSSAIDFNWLYETADSVRTMPEPDLLFDQIGGYEAELVLGILGWKG